MMATTHALWGMALALPVLATAPEYAPAAFLAGLVGGFAPDADMYTGHRKTLHFPVYASIAVIPAAVLAVLVPTMGTIALAVGLAAAALHAVSDVLGGGIELRPWQGTSERAVYSHYHGRWLRPRRVVRYDGAPEDLALAGVVAVPLLAIGNEVVTAVVIALLAVSSVYVVLRKSLAGVAARLAGLLPAPVREHVPARYLET
ncbi:metal-dependent hydrolase [Natrarchaeobius chitinivorans]|uniref:Metal-dependent hydrolase n=1 Tax=Natrarchaeobius chitinivorans TaxID=1679083 RepID=A0A3N6MM29_NATCH|nr:metal-dependent hydrolase [Natrarchaeobius chitinivorans]RQG95476.1 metal-dependent hydrolase [Natrarchaeobius chitinivorans]